MACGKSDLFALFYIEVFGASLKKRIYIVIAKRFVEILFCVRKKGQSAYLTDTKRRITLNPFSEYCSANCLLSEIGRYALKNDRFRADWGETY